MCAGKQTVAARTYSIARFAALCGQSSAAASWLQLLQTSGMHQSHIQACIICQLGLTSHTCVSLLLLLMAPALYPKGTGVLAENDPACCWSKPLGGVRVTFWD